MKLKPQAEIDDLIRYVRWYEGMKTSSDAWNWLNENIPTWMQQHDTKITYEDIITDDSK